MRRAAQSEPNARHWPDLWKLALIAICTLILCSCRSPAGACRATPHGQPSGDSLPDAAYTAAPEVAQSPAPMGPPGMEQGVPMPYVAVPPSAPPGIALPWPEDEYLRDGGNDGHAVGPGRNGEVVGLHMEDTVAQYETLNHCKVVQPSNEVYIYSPRFGAVRQVVSLVAAEERQKAGGVHEPLQPQAPTTTQLVYDTKQNVQLDDQISARPASAMRVKQGGVIASSAIRAKGFQDAFKPYENLSIIRLGQFDEAEMPFLARGSNAAIAWSHTQAVQVILDRKTAMADVKYDKALTTYTVDSPGPPRLRLIKVASTPFANPGEVVDFTIRFDNLGAQPIGNVEILDSLNTRLEYIPDSAQCSVDATFSTQPNEGDSVVLRCELSHPLDVGKGGILRFRCRVR